MANHLTNAYVHSQEIKETNTKLQSHENDLSGIKTSQKVFTLGTYFIYFSFTSVIFAGVTVWNLQDYIFGNYTNVIGMVWALVTVFIIPLALSLAKHYNYKAIAKGSAVGHGRGLLAVRAIIALALLSGLYYEAISASSNLQSKAFHAVDYKSNLQGILAAPAASSGSSAIAAQIADAEYKLVSCQRKVRDGKVKDCDNSTAKVNSLKAQAQAERESAGTANVAAIGAKQNALSNAVSEQALPAAKYVAEMAGRSNDYGTMVIVIIAALFFELIHITTIFNETRALRGIDNETGALKNLNAQYFNATGKTFDEEDFKDNRRIDLSDTPLTLETAKAGESPTLFKYQTNEPDNDKPRGFPGFVNTDNMPKAKRDAPLDTPEMKQTDGMKQSPEQLAKVRELAADTTGELYRNTLRNGSPHFHDQPLDRPTPCTVHANQQQPTTRVVPCTVHGDDGVKEFTDDLYQKLKRMVEAGEVAPTYRPVKEVLKGWNVGTSDRHRQDIAGQALDRMAADGALKPNPENNGSTIKKAKYILA